MVKNENTTFVTKEECSSKHIPRWLLVTFGSLIIALMGLFIILIEVNCASANNMTTKMESCTIRTEKIASKLETTTRLHEFESQAILQELTNIRKEITLLRQEQKELLERVIKLEK